jgi:hypothetical protein
MHPLRVAQQTGVEAADCLGVDWGGWIREVASGRDLSLESLESATHL